MPSLSQVTLETRAVLKWGGIFLGIIIVFFLFLKIKTIFAPPPPPTVGFGKLPAIEFPQSSGTKKFTYSVDTISGTLPAFVASQKVFKMIQTEPDLLSLSRASHKANTIGFGGKPSGVSENLYQWENSNRVLTMSILDYNFNLSSDYLLKPNTPNFSATANDAINTSKNFLSKMDLLPSDIDDSQTQTDLFSIKKYKLVPVSSLSDSQVVRVDFFQKPFNGLPIYYPGTPSPMNFLIGTPDQNGQQILEANFFYQKPSDISSTYPIKTAEQALEDLKKGQGYIVKSPEFSRVSIKNVNLGYYISDKRQSYLLPIIVFEGDNFRAFVPAVTDEWVNK